VRFIRQKNSLANQDANVQDTQNAKDLLAPKQKLVLTDRGFETQFEAPSLS
jgi:hypothetical protein